uniref:Vomeronasal type-1 receptor n=1 Tax=Nannospalax galili TaxID=1026970 RepID=A0A4Y1N5Y9_NANGA|nr:vomeronasal type 1 receptor 8 [Nannospalax galili]AWV49607.1 vomeronasal type 1 receptor 8 [Nannospalax galili]
MLQRDPAFGGFLISQLCVGVLGNSLFLVLYVYTFLVQPRFKKPIDVIFMHLTLVNMLTIIFILVPAIVSSFGVSQFLNNAGCKVVLYIFRVTRGLSICTTCILSTFQSIIITPSNSQWVWLKSKLSTWTFYFFLFSWFINLIIYVRVIETVMAKTNYTRAGCGYSQAYCEVTEFGNIKPEFFLSVILIRDHFFVVLMMWTSLYMVILLYRHRKRAQHVHSTRLSSQSSPERKATQNILLLVSCFVFFFWVNDFVTLYEFYMPEKMTRLRGLNTVLTTCYPTISPFLLMKNSKVISQFTSSQSLLRITGFQRALRG